MKSLASVSDIKAHLSAYLDRVKRGEEVVVTERGVPIARLVPMRAAIEEERLAQMGARGIARLPESALPEALLCPSDVLDPEGDVLSALLEERREGR